MRFVLAPLFALAAFANGRCLARDSAGRYVRDSAQPDSAFRGPHYRFTGQEDSTLLAAIFAKTFQLGKEDAGGLARPSAFCISIGRGQQTDAPPSVLRLLSTHQPRVVAASACEVNAKGRRFAVIERSSGRRGWLGTISALRAVADSTVVGYSSFYVEPLFAAGWTCEVIR